MAQYKEVERIDRELGDENDLRASLIYQARVMRGRRDVEGGIGLYQEVDRMSGQSQGEGEATKVE
jgi:hypothetical protein